MSSFVHNQILLDPENSGIWGYKRFQKESHNRIKSCILIGLLNDTIAVFLFYSIAIQGKLIT